MAPIICRMANVQQKQTRPRATRCTKSTAAAAASTNKMARNENHEIYFIHISRVSRRFSIDFDIIFAAKPAHAEKVNKYTPHTNKHTCIMYKCILQAWINDANEKKAVRRRRWIGPDALVAAKAIPFSCCTHSQYIQNAQMQARTVLCHDSILHNIQTILYGVCMWHI